MFGVGRNYVATFGMVMALTFGAAMTPLRAETVLVVTKPDGGEASLSFSDLEAMPRVTFKTATLWTDGVQEFSGVPLKRLLQDIGITDGTVQAVALNDYSITIPVSGLEDHAPIIADRIDGKKFGRRDKGPLWIVYPYDADAKYRSEETYGRSVWQLVKLTAQ